MTATVNGAPVQPGVSQLGYLIFEVSDLAAWEAFATGVLGMVVARRASDGSLALRHDGHAQRIVLRQGPADDLAVLGWEAADGAALDAIAARLTAAGVTVTPGSAADATERRVQRLVRFSDAGGIPCELVCGAELASEPFVSPVVPGGFVADELGLGHAVISARSQAESLDFYTRLLGFRLSDQIVTNIHGYAVDIVFLHANRRHHSIAFGNAQRRRMHHFMIEARDMDEVGLAFDRAVKAGVPIMQTIGRHPNDRMLSFYAKTPSGFQFEFGWGGREVDDATWPQGTVYDRISDWGHHPPQFLAPRPKEPR